MINILSDAHFTDEAKQAKFMPHPVLQIIIYIFLSILFTNAQMAAQMIFAPVLMSNGEDEMDIALPLALFSTAVPAALAILYCRFVEKRSLGSMGITKKGFPKNYFYGMAMGFAAFTLSLVICIAAGAARYTGTAFSGNIPYLIIICVGWGIQGAEEEILYRGWLMPGLSQKLPLWAAVVGNAVIFSLAHFFNTGFSFLAFVNITLMGIAFSLIALRFDSILPACAFHSVWNAVQGNFYGLPVSGIPDYKSVFVFELSIGKNLITGGDFGIEGGIPATIAAAVIILLAVRGKK